MKSSYLIYVEEKIKNIDNRLEHLENKLQGLFLRIDNLEKENLDLRKENQFLRQENLRLGEENSDLRARLKINSTNSSKPPSSDGLSKKPAFPRQKGGKRGEQEGHEGNTLKMSDKPEAVVLCRPPERCSRCGSDLRGIQYNVVSRRQVMDLPEPRLEVTEYRLCECICPICSKEQPGTYPPEVRAPVQYGNKIRAITVLLNNEYKMPYEKISQLFNDLFGYSINESTIVSSNEACSNNLTESEQVIKQAVIDSPVVHFDESGIRVDGKIRWLHNSSTEKYTYIFADLYRGVRALESRKSLIRQISGWAVHDCWGAYFMYDNFKHAICGAHIIRELRFQEEIKKRKWACKFKNYLLDLYKMPYEERVRKRVEIENRFDELCHLADQEEPPPSKTVCPRYEKTGRTKKTQGRNLFERMLKLKESILAFAFNKEVPFTNNQAERDIRPAKIKLKVSGSFRSLHGAECYARIQAFISTTRKHNLPVYQELCAVFKGYSFLTMTTT
ncbi:MAG: IS66 family transposase [Bacteroidota bacterium]